MRMYVYECVCVCVGVYMWMHTCMNANVCVCTSQSVSGCESGVTQNANMPSVCVCVRENKVMSVRISASAAQSGINKCFYQQYLGLLIMWKP